MGGTSAGGQTVRVVGPDRVTVTAESTSLGALLDELARISPIESLKIDPADRAVAVSLIAEDVVALDAMWLALKASGLDFVMSSRSIVAGRAKKALEESSRAAAERAELDAANVEPEREAAQAPPTAASHPPAVDEHDLVQPVVLVLPPAQPSVVERPGAPPDLVVTESMFDKGRQPKTSEMLAQPMADEFGRDSGGPRVSFTIQDDSVTITQPGFVPFKLRPDVVNRRLRANLADIP